MKPFVWPPLPEEPARVRDGVDLEEPLVRWLGPAFRHFSDEALMGIVRDPVGIGPWGKTAAARELLRRM